jgi:hypothetical protein
MARTVQPDWSLVFRQAFTRKAARRVAEKFRKERERETQEAVARYEAQMPVREEQGSYKP